MSTRNLIIRGAVLGLLLLSCGPTADPNYLLNKPRILGIDVSVEGDELRTEPAPGERVNLRIPFAAPGPQIDASAFLAVCLPGAGSQGVSFCGSDPFAFELILPGRSELDFSFEVPADLAGSDIDQLLLIGAVCLGGDVNFNVAEFDPSAPPSVCMDDDDLGYLVTSTIDLRGSTPANTDPQFATIEIGDATFTSAADPRAEMRGCAGDGLQTVRPQSDEVFELRITPTADSRETYIRELDGQERTENVEVRILVTYGSLERALTLVDDEDPVAINEWSPPPADEIPPEGLLGQFFITLRDGRGGFANEARALCILPPE